MRTKALQLPATHPAYGLLAGWSEADSCLEEDPPKYIQPYFSNSTEAARGFADLGKVWEAIGRKTSDAELTRWGQQLASESVALRKDIQTAVSRSLLNVDGKKVLPSIAGVKEPTHIALQHDKTDAQFRAYRAYMEMMYSGNLNAEQVRMIVDYRKNHHDVILGMPLAYNIPEFAGFLSYGYGYGLIQHDMIREALLLMYSDMAHQYTRGSWMAPETRIPFVDSEAAPYCSPSQLVVSLMTRWLLIFEDPESNTVWLGKSIPREWLADGKTIDITNAPTKWGRLSFSIVSHLKTHTIDTHIDFPNSGFVAETKLRLRSPNNARIKSVTLSGKRWTQFDPVNETIAIPSGMQGRVEIVAHY
jgi:hypothetical protein